MFVVYTVFVKFGKVDQHIYFYFVKVFERVNYLGIIHESFFGNISIQIDFQIIQIKIFFTFVE